MRARGWGTERPASTLRVASCDPLCFQERCGSIRGGCFASLNPYSFVVATKRRFIVVPRWDEFQHYKDRDPKWIKNYTRLLASREYLNLSLRLRGILHGIWLAYAASGRELGASPAEVGLMLGDTSVRMRDLISLEKAGFVQLLLAPRYQDASLEVEKEKERTKGLFVAKDVGQQPLLESQLEVKDAILRSLGEAS